MEEIHLIEAALKADEDKLNFLLIQIDQQYNSISQTELNQLNPSSNIYQVIFNSKKNLESLKIQFKNYIDNANKCLSLHDQRDSLLKFQLAESRSKCELLEQSLRVIAQENFELESGKMRLPDMKMKTATSSELSAKASVDDDNILETTTNLSLAETDQNEEFFDPADDPLTDEENKDDANDNEDFDNKSLAMISCYGSLEQLTTGIHTEGENKIQSQLSLVESKKIEKVANLMDLIERDEFGWR
ncbi:unnamed protein product [Brachionus calyciflorus]|uniref:Uncharacterized protein n=1 Tax=Brachionus calyciflorus TaxID=104777 RepID=A0A813LXG0_9BILA|nr:unnamed protein product [Brachionus calyciflorus]